ncbi:hypothetical protein KM043_011512 [Ampulex compressa]|nr:hypothetical protein KM043_011512 [Ampulex compressa]
MNRGREGPSNPREVGIFGGTQRAPGVALDARYIEESRGLSSQDRKKDRVTLLEPPSSIAGFPDDIQHPSQAAEELREIQAAD